MSSVTEDSSIGVEEVTVETKSMKVPHIRISAKSAQLHRAAAVKEKRQYNQAFKRVTVIYDREKKKPDGMSAQTVVEHSKSSARKKGTRIVCGEGLGYFVGVAPSQRSATQT